MWVWGAFDFFVDDSRAFFLEGFAHLNGGFPLWQSVAKTSAVAWQVAAFDQREPKVLPEIADVDDWAAGVGARIFSEDPVLQLPQAGQIFEVGQRSWRDGKGAVELFCDLAAGSKVSTREDRLLGMLVSTSEDSEASYKGIREALGETWFAGSIQTNEHFLAELMDHPWVREGIYHAQFVEEEFIPEIRPTGALLTLFATVVAASGIADDVDVKAGGRWVVGDQWAVADLSLLEGWERTERDGVVFGKVQVPEQEVEKFCVYPVAPHCWKVRVGAWFMQVRRVYMKDRPANVRPLNSLVSGKVHSILFQSEVHIEAHDPIVLIESMGVLVPHALPLDARILAWEVKAQDVVTSGQRLARFEMLS